MTDDDLAALTCALGDTLRLAATELVVAHHIAAVMGVSTEWFIDTAVFIADFAHALHPIPTQEQT